MVHDDAPEYNFDPFFPLSGADRAHVWRDLGGVDAQCAMGSVPAAPPPAPVGVYGHPAPERIDTIEVTPEWAKEGRAGPASNEGVNTMEKSAVVGKFQGSLLLKKLSHLRFLHCNSTTRKRSTYRATGPPFDEL